MTLNINGNNYNNLKKIPFFDNQKERTKKKIMDKIKMKYPIELHPLFAKTTEHPFHLVDPSPWPLFTSMASFIFLLGIVMFLHG